ncbi:helix-turn-helix domain-containing protein [Mesorhizobium sp. M1393]|uniref:helix-turn-helix domain-containing protein n=1 Tax=Mesorhizobium sp. M1393 TaxID=2957094 RepID=UPI0033380A38
MDERLRFVVECLAGDETMSELCAAYGISRKTGYKWLGRYRALGPEGLHDLPRAPLNHGRATALDLVERIVAAKETHPLWGPKKIMARLRRTAPELAWPSASTAGAILARHGLVSVRKRARLRACGNGPWPQAEEPNAVWTGDHKGWFRTRDGWRCEPLTVMDASSRYLLALEATGSTADDEAWPVFERLFEAHGLPDRLRSDNGPPFASAGVTGLTPLSVRFIKLGITLERIAPGKPQQNGRHERFHLTMLPLAKAPEADRMAQGQAFEAFRHAYNEERPHEALAMDPGAALPLLAARYARDTARARLSGRGGGAQRAPQWRDQVERRLRLRFQDAGRRSRRRHRNRGWSMGARLPCPSARYPRHQAHEARPPPRRANQTPWRGGGQHREKTVTHVSGSKCYPSINWTPVGR